MCQKKKRFYGKIVLDPEINKIKKIKSKLIESCQSLVITVSDNDHPDIGYAPYIYKDNYFYQKPNFTIRILNLFIKELDK